jgi:hypothetical protein
MAIKNGFYGQKKAEYYPLNPGVSKNIPTQYVVSGVNPKKESLVNTKSTLLVPE